MISDIEISIRPCTVQNDDLQSLSTISKLSRGGFTLLCVILHSNFDIASILDIAIDV